MDMANIAKIVLFISACASLFGLTVFLFRDQIFSQMGADGEDRKTLSSRQSDKPSRKSGSYSVIGAACRLYPRSGHS
jgi:hypothetical protein